MKHTLFTLLAAFVASPAFAGNLTSSDWERLCDSYDNHAHNFTFVDGNLIAHGGVTSGFTGTCDLSYTSTAHKMENGSSLAITLQFASTQGLEDFTVAPYDIDVACLWVWTYGDSFVLTQWDSATDAMNPHLLTEASETSASLTLNFIVENGNLCYTYKFNGGGESEKFTVVEGINTSLAWQPRFSWNVGNATEVTVTDVTFSTSSPMVPEPATATLSLLALAGLAARRRRK